MRRTIRTLVLLGVAAILPSAAWAQVALAGTVKDASGAVLPGVTVEASSPVLIEKTRTATTDATGQYRIERLQPGTYSVTFTLSGFSTLKHEDVELSGTGVVKIDGDMKVGGVAETVTVTGGTPLVDVQSTRRDVTLDNDTMRDLPGVRSYSYLLEAVPGLQTNNNNVNTGPVFAIFPIHGGRGVESRLTVDGLNISNPPGGNQPSNYVADIGNTQEVTMTTSGGLAESETAGLTINIVPKQGGNTMSGLAYASGFSQGMQSNNYTPALAASGVSQPDPVYHVYDLNGAVGGPIVKDKLWYYMSVREQGQRQNTLNVYYNMNAGNPNAWTYVPNLSQPAYSDRTWENYTPRITWQANQTNKFSFVWDEQPVCRLCSGTTSLTGSPNFIFPTSPEADGHGEFSPQRVQQAHWTSPVTNKLLLEAGVGTSSYEWGGKELNPNPGANLVQVVNIGQEITPLVTTNMQYRSQSWLNNHTDGVNYFVSASYVTGSHSMKFGYQGDYWVDDRQLNVNSQGLRYTFVFGAPSSITEYANGYNVNANAAQASLFAQDQWTFKRVTLQGGLRWDHPWSWFPAQSEPASTFFPGTSFPGTSGVTGYNDITPRMGVVYDLFGNGKTALKVNAGKYLQGASVSNLAYGDNPALRIPGATTSGGTFAPSTSRSWTAVGTPATNPNYYIPNCNLQNPQANGACGTANPVTFGSNQFVGAQFDPAGLSGWGVRPSDWSYGVSVQQQLFARASVEVGYYRRSFTQFTTSGTVTENLANPASDLTQFSFTAPSDPRLPGGGGYTISNLYNVNPNVFGQSNQLIEPTNRVGNDTRVFDGVDATFNVRAAHGFTFQGGTSTGKVVNNFCAISAAVPSNYLLNPYCSQESPWQTAFHGLAIYTVPHIDVILSTVYQDKPNVGTDELSSSLQANYTLTAANIAAVSAQLGRPMTTSGPVTINLIPPGTLYGPRVRELDLSMKKVIRVWGRRLTGGLDIYNVLNNNVALAFNQTYAPGVAGWLAPTTYMNPRVFRLSAEFAF
jgi:hypothetical protein